MSASLNKWFLVTALLLSVVGAAAPAVGGQAAPSACCCSAGSCHCPDSGMTWIPSCCASDDAVPEPFAAEHPTTPVPTDSGCRSVAGNLVVPPEENGDRRTIAPTGGSAPPGVALFTLHASFLI